MRERVIGTLLSRGGIRRHRKDACEENTLRLHGDRPVEKGIRVRVPQRLRPTGKVAGPSYARPGHDADAMQQPAQPCRQS